MRLRLVAIVLVALACAPAAGAAPAFRIALKAPTHTPKVNERWPWSIRVTTAGGKLLPARISVAVVDPIGGVHPVEYGCCKNTFITNVRIKGTFHDYVQYPLVGKGYRLTFRVTVRTALGTRAVRYWVKTI